MRHRLVFLDGSIAAHRGARLDLGREGLFRDCSPQGCGVQAYMDVFTEGLGTAARERGRT